jgi:hypothetical protein
LGAPSHHEPDRVNVCDRAAPNPRHQRPLSRCSDHKPPTSSETRSGSDCRSRRLADTGLWNAFTLVTLAEQ